MKPKDLCSLRRTLLFTTFRKYFTDRLHQHAMTRLSVDADHNYLLLGENKEKANLMCRPTYVFSMR